MCVSCPFLKTHNWHFGIERLKLCIALKNENIAILSVFECRFSETDNGVLHFASSGAVYFLKFKQTMEEQTLIPGISEKIQKVQNK